MAKPSFRRKVPVLFNPYFEGLLVQTFPQGIRPKVNAIEQLEFEFAYSDVAIPHIRESSRVVIANVMDCGLEVILPSRMGLKNTPTTPLQRGKLSPNECPGYNTKQSDSDVPMMLELWGMQSASSLPLLPGPLGPGMVAPDRALSMG